MIPTNRPPTHPGIMLRDEYMAPFGVSVVQLAEKVGMPVEELAAIVNGEHPMTPTLALELAYVFGTRAEFWMRGQMNYDAWHAIQEAGE